MRYYEPLSLDRTFLFYRSRRERQDGADKGQMSRHTFTENVINLAIESCLVSDIEEIITPKKVHLMDAEVVRDLASESPDVAFEREFLQGQIKKLKDGLGVCRRYKPLGATGQFWSLRTSLGEGHGKVPG